MVVVDQVEIDLGVLGDAKHHINEKIVSLFVSKQQSSENIKSCLETAPQALLTFLIENSIEIIQ